MRINFETVLAHASERLAVIDRDATRQEQVNIFKRFLKIETERLRIRHRFGLGGNEITSGRCYLVDLVVCRACHLAASEFIPSDELNNCAVIALGGYGRRELAPCSDVDILFLQAGRRSKNISKFVEQVLYLLWDMGLTVGHSFRSISDCVAMARNDLHSRTAMAEARLLTGNAHLFRRLARELDDSIFKNRRETSSFLETMRQELEARYDRFGRAVCVQEPNVKEGVGGLRDLHAVLWIGHARYGARGLDDLRAQDIISGEKYAAARRAYDFIARVRNEAHFTTNRRTDLLTLDLQPTLAANLNYKPKRGLMASEIFMRDYYRRAQELHHFCESFLVQAMEARSAKRRIISRAKPFSASFENRQGQFYLTIRRNQQAELAIQPSYEVRRGKLYLKNGQADFRSNAMRMIEAFAVAQNEGIALSDELKLAIRSNLSLVDRNFRASKEAGHSLIAMLNRKGRVGFALRMMHEAGFLGRLLPEFARVTFLVQHDFYHKYTIDEHTLKAIEALDLLASEYNDRLARFSKVFAEIEHAAPLYLGLLLHDIGKGRGKGHVERGVHIAKRVCERLNLDERSAQQVSFLVKHHLLMSHISQRRDLNEEGLIKNFVATVDDLDHLNSLLLLTYADTSGVGPGVWNDWKATLLWELYTRARQHFTGGRPRKWDWSHAAQIKQSLIESLRAEFVPSEVERHLAMMPERYLRATEPERVAQHFRAIKQLGNGPLAVAWSAAEDKHYSELTIYTQDSAGLIARIAGTLTASGINILSADVYTREDGLVIDTFKVCEPSGHSAVAPAAWPKVERNLKAAIEGSFNVAAAVEMQQAKAVRPIRRRKHHQPIKPSVRFDSEASATNTVIEVKAEDELGLVYKIASTLAGLGLSINFAKIATEKSHALDVFYVTDSEGEKLRASDMPHVERALVEALGGEISAKLKEAV
ncbi:MAG TPA: [protein-PII] uridylyltransferase [Blastocatellia bacterium]|nr:[protein-PII] uridylyltransferase [Blastocatellia bacterium]